jgi:O-antigen/teichoic acid export membrane protein
VAYAGVDLALMRPGADSREHYDTAWTIQLIQGASITAALLIISPWVAPLFSEPRATAVVQVIALRSLLAGLQNIGIVAFRKELDFAKDFRFTLYTKLLNFGVVVGSAFALRNYWALVIAMTTSALIDVSLSYLMHPYRPRLCMKRSREIWSFSQWLILSRVGSFLNRKTDEFVVARVLGTGPMGGYHVANELATMPNSELVMPLRRALFPTLAKIAKDTGELERLFVLSFSTIAVLSLSVGFCLMATAAELVPIVLGPKWVSAVGAMRWLALYGALSSLVLTLEVPLWVTGQTRLSAAQTWLELALLVPLAYAAARSYGVEGAAFARAAVSLVVLPAMLLFVARACSVRVGRLFGALWRPLVAGLVMALAQELAGRHGQGVLALTLLLKLVTAALVFPASLGLLWLASGRPPGIEAQLVGMLSAWRRSRRRTATGDLP